MVIKYSTLDAIGIWNNSTYSYLTVMSKTLIALIPISVYSVIIDRFINILSLSY